MLFGPAIEKWDLEQTPSPPLLRLDIKEVQDTIRVLGTVRKLTSLCDTGSLLSML